LAHFSQAKTEAPLPTGALLTMETTKEIGNRSAFSSNETKKETVLSRSRGNETMKKTLVVLLPRCSLLLLNS